MLVATFLSTIFFWCKKISSDVVRHKPKQIIYGRSFGSKTWKFFWSWGFLISHSQQLSFFVYKHFVKVVKDNYHGITFLPLFHHALVSTIFITNYICVHICVCTSMWVLKIRQKLKRKTNKRVCHFWQLQ